MIILRSSYEYQIERPHVAFSDTAPMALQRDSTSRSDAWHLLHIASDPRLWPLLELGLTAKLLQLDLQDSLCVEILPEPSNKNEGVEALWLTWEGVKLRRMHPNYAVSLSPVGFE